MEAHKTELLSKPRGAQNPRVENGFGGQAKARGKGFVGCRIIGAKRHGGGNFSICYRSTCDVVLLGQEG